MAMLSGIIKTEEISLPRLLPIAQIRRDGGTQPRAGLDEDAINDYVAALANGAEFPAIEVMYDGESYWLFDGFHRIETHLRSGRTEVLTLVHKGTLEDAQWRSYGANKSHGLRRSSTDKERAIRAALRHPQAPGMSDSALARHLGVSDKTVTKYRTEMEVTSEIPKSPTRTGADGRTINTSNIGKSRALAPTLRTLTLDETIAVIWRVLRNNAGHQQDAERLAWLQAHDDQRHYQQAINVGMTFIEAIFQRAIGTVIIELQTNINRAQRKAAPAAPPVAVVEPAAPPARYSPEFLDGMADVVRGMASELGEVCNFSIAINGGEFQVGATVAGERPRFATGKAVTLGEAWAKLKAKLGG